MMKKIFASIAICSMLISVGNTMVIHVEAEESVKSDNSDKQQSGLDDYSSMYGCSNDQIKPIITNTRARSKTQEVNYLAIFVEFPNRTAYNFSDALVNAETMMNSPDGFDSTIKAGVVKRLPSLKSFINKYSYGKMNVTTDMFPKSDVDGSHITFTVTHDKEYYMPYSATNTQGYKDDIEQKHRESDLIREILNGTKSQIANTLDAGSLDTNNDGYVDAISFFVEGGKQNSDSEVGWRDLLWSHKLSTNTGIDINGINVGSYNLIYSYQHQAPGGTFSLNRSGYGPIIHEYLHTLGLPDLYRYSESNANPVGFYDIMGATNYSCPQGLLAELTNLYGIHWNKKLNNYNVSTKGIVIQKPKYKDENENRAIKVQSPLNSDEYFVVEYYESDTDVIPNADSSGLIVYRVNPTIKDGNMAGTALGTGDNIYIYRPGEVKDNFGYGDLSKATLNTKRNHYGKVLGDNDSSFNNESIFYSDGSNSGVKINIVNEDTDSITIDLTVPSMEGTGTESQPFIISDAEQFQKYLTGNHDKYFKLGNDIDFKDSTFTKPIENFDNYLDGAGHTIKNIDIDGEGIFGTIITNYSVKNLKVSNVSVTSHSFMHVGIICSELRGQLDNVIVESGSVTGPENTGGSYVGVGGLVGTMIDSSSIINCGCNTDILKGFNNGGIVGLTQGTPTIKNSYSIGTIAKGTSNTGGIIGANISEKVLLEDCYFDYKMAGTKNSIGDSTDDNPNVNGYSINDTLEFNDKTSKTVSLDLTSSGKLDYNVTFDDAIASFDNITKEITPIKNGTTKAYLTFKVGTHTVTKLINIKITHVSANDVPEITDLKTKDITKNGYTVTFKATDDGKITKVESKTYSELNGQDKVITKVLSESSGEYILNIDKKEFNNQEGQYVTTINVYDDEGEVTTKTIKVTLLSNVKAEITDLKTKDITKNGYTVTFKATDDGKITKVESKTYSELNGKDKVATKVLSESSGEYVLNIDKKDFNNQEGQYVTTINVYDDEGEVTSKTVNLLLTDSSIPLYLDNNPLITTNNKIAYSVNVYSVKELTEAKIIIFLDNKSKAITLSKDAIISYSGSNKYLLTFELNNLITDGNYSGYIILSDIDNKSYNISINDIYIVKPQSNSIIKNDSKESLKRVENNIINNQISHISENNTNRNYSGKSKSSTNNRIDTNQMIDNHDTYIKMENNISKTKSNLYIYLLGIVIGLIICLMMYLRKLSISKH